MNELVVDATDAALYTESFLNMKVADLRKELKARGLPTAGNKTELIERLQGVQESVKDDLGVDSELENLSFSSLEKEISREAELLGENLTTKPVEITSSESFIETEEIRPSPVKPLKKRMIVNSSGGPAEKKPVLNRTLIVMPSLEPVEESIVPKTAIRKLVMSTEVKNISTLKKPASTVKTMSASERLAMRAKRFNVKPGSETGKLQITSKGITAFIKSTSKPDAPSTILNTTPDMDILKKRAERFGQNVSNVMKQIEEKERVLKRKLRFGASAVSSARSASGEQDRKKWRAERFGVVST